jgi:hypothetical protein
MPALAMNGWRGSVWRLHDDSMKPAGPNARANENGDQFALAAVVL